MRDSALARAIRTRLRKLSKKTARLQRQGYFDAATFVAQESLDLKRAFEALQRLGVL